jgi:hypothetical protein
MRAGGPSGLSFAIIHNQQSTMDMDNGIDCVALSSIVIIIYPHRNQNTMRRSQSSSLGLSSSSSSSSSNFNQRRSIFSAPSSTGSSAAAAAAGRSMLNRPRANPSYDMNVNTFIASAAGPVPRRNSEATLKSCLSSNSINTMKRSKSSVNGFANEEFKMTRNVSFSHLQIREYEVTLGDNPSVSSGAPISLGWNYDPNEKISRLPEVVECGRRSSNSFRLGDRERQRMLRSNPSVSEADLTRMLSMIADIKFQRKQSLNEIHEEMEKQTRLEMGTAMLNELSFYV